MFCQREGSAVDDLEIQEEEEIVKQGGAQDQQREGEQERFVDGKTIEQHAPKVNDVPS